MSKRNKKTEVINIQNLNFEIDYDKLAESIVKAQNKKAQKSNGKLRSSAMSILNSAFYSIVYIIAGFFVYVTWFELYSTQSTSLFGCVLLTFILVFVGVYSFLCQIESFKDREKDAREHFNINISLIALIVAIIALFKGVG